MGEKEAIQNIINEIGSSLTRWGLPSAFGKVYAELYLKGDMTQEQLKENVGCANSMISQSLTILENFGVVKKVGKEGRKAIYGAVRDTKEIMRKTMRDKLSYQIEPFLDVVNDNYAEIKNPEIKERLDKLKKQMEWGKRITNILLKLPGI